MLQETTRTVRRRAPWIAALTVLTGAVAVAWQSFELNDSDHRKLGKVLAKYFEPKTAEKGKEEFISELEKIGKKRGAKSLNDSLQAALMLHADLGRALGYSTDFKNLRAGKATTVETEFSGEKFQYTMLIPSTYKSNGAPLPLVLCVPSMRDGKPMPTEIFLQENLQDPALRENAILTCVAMPEDVSTWHLRRTPNGGTGGVYSLMVALGDVLRSANIDADRVYLVGREQGAAAAMATAASYPHLFAGVVTIAGDIGEVPAENFCNLPTLLQGGGQSTAFEAKNKELGYNNCTIKADLTPTDLWPWMQQSPRVSNPAKVVILPAPMETYNAYWLRVPRTEGLTAAITATADRTANTLKIDAPNVETVTLFLNDSILDLSNTIKVVINGAEQQVKATRSVDDMLELARGVSDAGRLYVARLVLDAPR